MLQIIKIALEKYKISHDNKNYVILKNKNSGKVLSINGGSAKNSANMEQRDYKDEKLQKWIAVKQTNGRIVFLSALDADYCIDLQAAIAANESNIQLYSKNDTLAQQWKAVKYNPRIHWGRGGMAFCVSLVGKKPVGTGKMAVCPWWVKLGTYNIRSDN